MKGPGKLPGQHIGTEIESLRHAGQGEGLFEVRGDVVHHLVDEVGILAAGAEDESQLRQTARKDKLQKGSFDRYIIF